MGSPLQLIRYTGIPSVRPLQLKPVKVYIDYELGTLTYSSGSPTPLSRSQLLSVRIENLGPFSSS